MNHGEIPSFNVSHFLNTAQILVDADEPERALWLLTQGLPAYYRDNTPSEIVEARNRILRGCMTPLSYLDCKDDSIFCETPTRALGILQNTLRGQLVKKSVEDLNAKGLTPHLIEMGPGEYWLPQGLRALGLGFTYKDVAVNEYTKKQSYLIERQEWNGASPIIFCAQEVIEHLANPQDMAVELMRETSGRGASEIHVSTPFYTYDGKPKPIAGIRRNSLPHLRAYTPQEFANEATKVFGTTYKWELQISPVMSLVGTKR